LLTSRRSISAYSAKPSPATTFPASTWARRAVGGSLVGRGQHCPRTGSRISPGNSGLPLDHHEAGSDAAACAGVVLSAIRHSEASSLDDLFERFGFSTGTLTPDSFVGVSAYGGDLRDMLGADDADPNHPLYGRCISFTGAMFSMTRGEAAERIVEFGADFKQNVSEA
jgi:hypothetical protein